MIQVRGVKKSFRMGESTVEVLRGVDFDLAPGEFVAIEGRSGSGKSTLLHLMGALDSPDAGSIKLNGVDFASMSSSQKNVVRNREIGFVFQFYHLLPELNVLQNTLLATKVQHGWLGYRSRRAETESRAAELLKSLGVDHRMKHKPQQLSGGERQRVAIARALMNKPRVLLADEPTGNLDVETGRQIVDVLEKLHVETGQSIVMVTHDRSLARKADRVLLMRGGVMVDAKIDV